jgi:hypothetical protein
MRGKVTWRFAALTQWPGKPTPAHQRKAAPFKATYERTRVHLERELAHLGARDVLLEADCDPSQVRLDGQLRSSAKLRGPGVIITCSVGGDVYRFPCDRFKHWDDNLRAISLTLERMRAVDRYGVTLNKQQYAGFKALPSHMPVADSRDAACAVLRKFSGMFVPTDSTRETLVQAFRSARAKTHPDAGGEREDWDAVEAAARVLGVLS